jgi:fructosamine-3-kinase
MTGYPKIAHKVKNVLCGYFDENRRLWIGVALCTVLSYVQVGTYITALYGAHLKVEPLHKMYKPTYRIYIYNMYYMCNLPHIKGGVRNYLLQLSDMLDTCWANY